MKFSKTVFLAFIALTLFTTYWSCKKEIITAESETTTIEQEASSRALCSGAEFVDNLGTTCPVYRGMITPVNKTLQVLLLLGHTAAAKPANASTASSTQCVWWKPVSGSIQFSSFSDLDNVIGPGSGQAHHIIPKQLCDGFGGTLSFLHIVVKTAAYDGFHPNDGYNGIRIPTVNHSGSHPAYTAWVKYQLDEYVLQKVTYSPREANKWIQCKLIPKLRTHIAATIATSPAQNVNTYFSTLPLTFIGK